MSFPTLDRGRAGYPPLLAQIHDPPPRLFLRGGSAELLAAPAVAVVGARSCSSYGSQIARMLGRELARAGLCVVSGLARGIDGEAHRGALEAGGPTVAVLGCGIDRDYPRRHAELAARIAENGMVVSEYPPGTEPAPWRFPARNRVIAGLALATVIVEARTRSGALITADFALELGREVFAVPGEITSALSAGTNELLRQGATPLLASGDILDALGIEPPRIPGSALAPRLAALLALLEEGACGVDDLVRRSGRSSAEVAADLVDLELSGLAVEADGIYRAAVPVSATPREAAR